MVANLDDGTTVLLFDFLARVLQMFLNIISTLFYRGEYTMEYDGYE